MTRPLVIARHTAAALLFVFAPLGALAQQAPADSGETKYASESTPRAPDGKPDLSGFWRGPLLRTMFASVPGGPPLNEAGKAAYEYNLTKSINPEGLCLFAGIPRASISGVPFQIVQNGNRVVFLYELMNTFRSIPSDGRPLPSREDVEPAFFGNGVGRWEGDVFIIESIGFKDRLLWIDDDAHPQSPNAHIVERWWRPDKAHLAHDVTIHDPTWTFSRVFTHMPPGEELIEFACNENNVSRDGGHLGYGPHEPSKYPPVSSVK